MSAAPATIGHYTVGREIGRGGMGVVYLARDEHLQRDVAIKALPEDLALDADRLARFEREATTLAALNHPNVAQIYGIEKQDGRKFLILEYVEGETLEDRLDHGALPVDEAIEIGVEICQGLEAAHDAGVVHRDLKPGNVKLTPDGKVKVLDFGLAKAGETGASRSDLVNSPTLRSPTQHSPTIPGAILGTAPYMSPEQARGRSVDKRTDIWSFGVVLYEMLSGIGPFVGETVTDSIGAILHKDVDLGQLPPDTPEGVRYVLRRCLARDRSRRLHDIADVRIELQEAESGERATRPASGRPRGPRTVLVAVAVVAVAIGAALVGRSTVTRSWDVQSPLYMELVSPQDTTLAYLGDLAGPVQVSPDGRKVVFLARDEKGVPSLWLRSMTSRDARILPGTERATFPFWSPDSESIGFFIENKLRRMDLGTGSTYTICAAQAGRGGTWTSDGEILFSPGFRDPLLRVDAEGGEPSVLTELDPTLHTSHRWPFALPDGRHFVFSAVHHDPERQEGTILMLGSLDGAAPRPLIRSLYRAEVVDDTLLFMREGTLMAARLDVERAQLAGDPAPLIRAVSEDPSTWHAGFSASPTGVLVYHRSRDQDGRAGSTVTSTGAESNVTLVYDRDGRVSRTIAEEVPQMSMTLSPQGDVLAIAAKAQGQDDFDLWLYPTGFAIDPSTGLRDPTGAEERVFSIQPTRLASEPGVEVSAVWSPDGTVVAYGRVWGENAQLGLFRRTIGGGAERLILAEDDPYEQQLWPTDWTRDGKWLVFARGSWIGWVAADVLMVSPDGGTPTPLVIGPAVEHNGTVSPDGRWLAYVSDESGVDEVYVIPFAPAWPDRQIDPAAPSPRWRVSTAGGAAAVWSSDGTELFYCTPAGDIISVRTDTAGDFFRSDAGTPLFRAGFESGTNLQVLNDGQRFFITDILLDEDDPISVVLNWKSLLERRGGQR